MRNIFSPRVFNIKNLVRILIITVVLILLANILSFLISIRFKIGDYYSYCLWADHVRFKQHEKEFELLTRQMYLFIDTHPGFFEEFTEDCGFTDEGLVFYKKNVDYPNNEFFYEVTESGWYDARNNYSYAFPDWFYYHGEGTRKIYPDYIVFYSPLGNGELIFTHDRGYPKELIDSYWDTNGFVLVTKHACGWYEVMLC